MVALIFDTLKFATKSDIQDLEHKLVDLEHRLIIKILIFIYPQNQ